MFDVIKPNTDVLVREKKAGEPYKEGDIIVFKSNGIKIIHKIEFILTIEGNNYYFTKGTNNQYIDDAYITEDQIKGIADLSKEAFNEVEKLIKENRIKSDITFGMGEDIDPNLVSKFEEYIDACYSTEKLREEFQKFGEGGQFKELLATFKEIYSKSYIEVLYQRYKTKFLSGKLLDRLYDQVKDFKILDIKTLEKIPGKMDRNKIYGIVERRKIVQLTNNLMEDTEIPLLSWLRLGNHDYSTKSNEGQALSHIIARHLNDFQEFAGINDPKKIAELILTTISQKTGVREESGWVFYKTDLISKKDGKPLYIRIGFDEFGSINTAYPTTFNYMKNKTIKLNPDVAIYLL